MATGTKHAGIALLLIAGLLAALYLIDPSVDGFLPCFFHQATGLQCAGCGTARAFHALLHGRVGEAFAYNPLSLLVLPPAAVCLIALLLGKRLPQRLMVTAGIVVLVAGIAFMVLRNIFPLGGLL